MRTYRERIQQCSGVWTNLWLSLGYVSLVGLLHYSSVPATRYLEINFLDFFLNLFLFPCDFVMFGSLDKILGDKPTQVLNLVVEIRLLPKIENILKVGNAKCDINLFAERRNFTEKLEKREWSDFSKENTQKVTIWQSEVTQSFTEEKLWQDNLLNWGQDNTQHELYCSVIIIPSNIVETLNVASSRLCKFIKFSLLKKEDMRVPFSTISWESNFHPLGGFIRFVYLGTLHNETRQIRNII